ncbi:MAG: histidine kinase [Rubritepida sp.]|nr:histidine kinase [Rubritepida sp.]
MGEHGNMTEAGAETELQRRSRIMAALAPVLIWMSGTDKLCDWFNAGWLSFTGRTMEQELGFGWAEGVHPEDYGHCFATYVTAFNAREPFSMEYRLLRHDGAWRWILDNGSPRFDEAGGFCGYVGSCVDVHEHREQAARLQDLLREKEVLLQEVHHRVKNNFALVMSLISLRSDRARNGEESEMLRDLIERIGVMAEIHEQLAEQAHADRIDFGGQLSAMVRRIGDLHRIRGVRVMEEIGSVVLPMGKAVSLGLIATELISNSYRHVFARQGGGRLWVSLATEPSGAIVLTVRDDGTGPATRPRPAGSVGMQIVDALATQLDAEVVVTTPPGMTVTLRLPPHP